MRSKHFSFQCEWRDISYWCIPKARRIAFVEEASSYAECSLKSSKSHVTVRPRKGLLLLVCLSSLPHTINLASARSPS